MNDINLRTPLFPHRVLVASAAHSDQFEASETAQILIGVARMGCKPDQVWFSRIQDANLIRYGFPMYDDVGKPYLYLEHRI